MAGHKRIRPGRGGVNRALANLTRRPTILAGVAKDKATPLPLYPLGASDLRQSLLGFLAATTDTVRLVRASEVSGKILSRYDLTEVETLRRQVQFGELSRTIAYPQQTDHSAHTLYLYLLGQVFFVESRLLRRAVSAHLKEKNTARLVQRFLFRWVYASLLHDVGYVLQGTPERERRAVDRLFRPASICTLLPESRAALRQALSECRLPRFESVKNPEDVFDELRRMPWAPDVGLEEDAFSTFDQCVAPGVRPTSSELEAFAYSVAARGYDGISGGVVDHAVASGLILLSYATLWYWLVKRAKYAGKVGVYSDAQWYLANDIVPACYAAAAHNVIGVYQKTLNWKLRLEDDPILYLGVLCDELQRWDRFPAGERYLGDLESFANACTESEGISLEVQGDKVVMQFRERAVADRIASALDQRLERPERLAVVKGPAGGRVAGRRRVRY